MNQTVRTKWSSVGRKLVMGITGLMLIGFLITHLAGNLLIFVGPDAMNAYSATLHGIHGFVGVELGLGVVFLIHIWTALGLVRDNRAARPVRYTEKKRETTLASITMPITGIIVLAFLIVHLATIRFANIEEHPLKVYGVTVDTLLNPALALLYIVGVVLLAPHLRHGIQSSLRSVGTSHIAYLKVIDKVAIGLAAILTIGFAIIPVWVLVTKG